MAQLYIGTSGYDYPEWAGVFYPVELKRKDYLSYYAGIFNAIEINSTFYRMPTAQQLMNLVSRSESRLHFSIKANRLMTHNVDSGWHNVAAEFQSAVKPLHNCGLLKTVLFQFPQAFHWTPDNRRYLFNLLNLFDGYPLAVEFRHREWVRDSVMEGLNKMNVTFVLCDMPHLKYLPDNDWGAHSVSQNEMYLRMHGRNAGAWYADSGNNGSARYEYEYSDNELLRIADALEYDIKVSESVQLYFNNHPNGYGVKNAINLRNLLKSKNIYL